MSTSEVGSVTFHIPESAGTRRHDKDGLFIALLKHFKVLLPLLKGTVPIDTQERDVLFT